jgi:hypothetical protein
VTRDPSCPHACEHTPPDPLVVECRPLEREDIRIVGPPPAVAWLGGNVRGSLSHRHFPRDWDLLEINADVHYRIGEYLPGHDVWVMHRERPPLGLTR